MDYICKPTRVQIYINTGQKSAAAIQAETGCDALINGGLYDMRPFTPNCWLRANGQTFHTENWTDWGYGWDKNDLILDSSANYHKYQNFITCVALAKDGQAIPLYYPPELGGARPRSAIGVTADKQIVLRCTSDPTTPEQLRRQMLDLGCASALMLDGGGSSQCITPNGKISSPRIVHNFICIWTKPFVEVQNPQCPYKEPTALIRWGSIGQGAKWVQWHLNRHGAKLDVDGLFFWQSVEALKKFQHSRGLAWDGVCGPLTREELKK